MVNRGSGESMELKNKRGIFFTSIVVVILSLFFLTSTFYSSIKERESIRDRIETMNNLIFSLEKDMSRQVYISSYRAILSIESHILETGEFVADAEALIEEAITNATINNQAVNLMEGFKLSDWNSRVSEIGEKSNLIINYTIENVEAYQEDPWNVKVQMTINLSVSDKSNLASWQKTETIEALIPITEFEDPLYLINTNGLVANKITRTPFLDFVNGNDITNLYNHANNSFYIASPSAPSFLDRLKGAVSSNENGIESLINLKDLSDQGIAIKDKSVVDYIYFSDSNPSACAVLPSGMPSWFKLDSDHLSVYEVSCAS